MPDPNKPSIPFTTVVGLVVMLSIGGATFLLTYGLVVNEVLRWAVTIPWLLYVAVLAIRDFVLQKAAGDASLDSGLFDRWTVAHGGAGLVFGLWYMPLVWVVFLTVLWEVFEALFRGFGDQETMKNRAMDVGIAIVLWAAVVVPAMLIAQTTFPLVLPHRP